MANDRDDQVAAETGPVPTPGTPTRHEEGSPGAEGVTRFPFPQGYFFAGMELDVGADGKPDETALGTVPNRCFDEAAAYRVEDP